MTEADWMGVKDIIIAIGALIGILVPAGLSIATFIRTGRLAEHQTLLAANVQKIETSTNSMKDALVKTTKEQALLEGAAQEKAAEAERKSLVAQGAASVVPTGQ